MIFSVLKGNPFVSKGAPTVDGSEIPQTHQLRLVFEIPIIIEGFKNIPGGGLGFLSHQPYEKQTFGKTRNTTDVLRENFERKILTHEKKLKKTVERF